jgi:hypothetical protein
LDEYFNTIRHNMDTVKVSWTDAISVMKADGAIWKLKDTFAGAYNESLLLGAGIAAASEKLGAWSGKIPEQFKTVTKEIAKARTIWDYMAEVGAKMKTAFDWQFAASNAAGKLVADRQILEYQLKIAIKYGDTLRANAIAQELADNALKIAEKSKDLTTAQDANSRALTGNSDAAIRNRSTLQGLTEDSIGWVQSMKTAGRTTAQMIEETKKQKQSFIDQAIAMGYSADELDNYTTMFDSLVTVLQKTPDKLDLSMKAYADMSPADAALHKWKQDNASHSIKVKIENPDWAKYSAYLDAQALATDIAQKNAHANGLLDRDAGKYRSTTIAPLQKKLDALRAKWGFAEGGLITGSGSGTSDSIPIMASNGEFMMKASAVRAYGLDFMNAVNNQQAAPMSAPVVNISGGGSDSQMVYLSPDDRALLRAAIDRPVNLYTENSKIAQSANAGNVELARRGKI